MRIDTKKVVRILFYMYISALFVLVIVKYKGSFNQLENTRNLILWNREQGFWNYNIIPFRTISTYLDNISDSYAYMNILGNIVPFIPFGLFVSFGSLKKKRSLKTLLLSLLCVSLFEGFQYISMLGYVIYYIYILISRLTTRYEVLQKYR